MKYYTSKMRPSWDETFIDMCEVLARRSTCQKYKTASIITSNNRIIGSGYNGVQSGRQHCDTHRFQADEHRKWSLENEIHAEMNAVLYCNSDTRGCTVYTLLFPCPICASLIINIGAKRVVYVNDYKGNASLSMLQENGVEVEKWEK